MKLKNLLYENNKDRLARHLTKEAKQDIIKSVSSFNEFGSKIYRTEEIKEMVEAIVKMSEGATQLALQETDDWFDSVTVKRDMNEVASSVKLFEKTARELSALQQRLESVYEDMGHKLGKYYEISEGNAFGAERAKAIANDEDEFTVDGKEFPVKSVDKEDEENAEEFTESTKLGSILKEGSGTWKVKFAKSNVNGVDFDGVSKVIARTPAEAIKKAVKVVQAKAGFKGGNNDWMAVDVDSVSKA